MDLSYFSLKDSCNFQERKELLINRIIKPCVDLVCEYDDLTVEILKFNWKCKGWDIMLKFDRSLYSFVLFEDKVKENGIDYVLEIIDNAIYPERLKRKDKPRLFGLLNRYLSHLKPMFASEFENDEYSLRLRETMIMTYLELCLSYLDQSPSIRLESRTTEDIVFLISGDWYSFKTSFNIIINYSSREFMNYLKRAMADKDEDMGLELDYNGAIKRVSKIF